MNPDTTQLLSTGADTANQLSGIAKLLADYGSEVVILAVFILLLIAIMTYMFKMFNKLFNSQQEQMNKLFDRLLDGGINTPQTPPQVQQPVVVEVPKPPTPQPEKESPPQSAEPYVIKAFKSACRVVLGELKCDRVAIYVMHDENRSTFGYKFVKMSCVYEETANGTSTGRGMLSHRGIPMTAFSSIIDCLIDNDEYIVGNAYDHGIIAADEKILNFIAGSLIKALFFSAIKDHHGQLIAFVVAEFAKEQDFSEIPKYNKCKKTLTSMASNIYPLLADNDVISLVKE